VGAARTVPAQSGNATSVICGPQKATGLRYGCSVDSKTARDQRFYDAVRHAMATAEVTQVQLGAFVADELDRDTAFAQATVRDWLTKSPPGPDVVFAIERVLNCRPGALSRLLGYVPADSKPARTVPEAIDCDPDLGDAERRVLKAAYRGARGK
jgi:hypothetical protein